MCKILKTSQNKWYVYEHIRDDNNEIFYIGIGCKNNFKRAYDRGNRRNIIWNRIANKTSYNVNIIAYDIDKECASNIEKHLINIYGRIDLETGTLANMTDGGDGIWGCQRSEETREKLRIQKLGKLNPMYGKHQSEETKNKRRQKLLGQTRTDQTKLKQSFASIKSGQAREVDVFDYITNLYIGRYHSISYAGKILGFNPSHACAVINGKRNHTHNFVFKYVGQ